MPAIRDPQRQATTQQKEQQTPLSGELLAHGGLADIRSDLCGKQPTDQYPQQNGFDRPVDGEVEQQVLPIGDLHAVKGVGGTEQNRVGKIRRQNRRRHHVPANGGGHHHAGAPAIATREAQLLGQCDDDRHENDGPRHARGHQETQHHVTDDHRRDDARVTRAHAIDHARSDPASESRALHRRAEHEAPEHQPQGTRQEAGQHHLPRRHRQNDGEHEEGHRNDVLGQRVGRPQADGENGERRRNGHRGIAAEGGTDADAGRRASHDHAAGACRR